MSNALALIAGDIQAAREDFQALLSDNAIKFEQEAGFAIQVLSANDYALSVATKNKASVIAAVKNLAAIGISLNPAKKQAYLVPRSMGKDKPAAICLDISYMGLMDLAIATGSIKWAKAEVVRESDGFELGRMDELPHHRYNPFAKDRGPIIGVYVVVKTADNEYLTHTMSADDVFAIRDRSEAWKAYREKKIRSCPWVTDESEMVKKTCVKQAYKYWPKTERLETAIHHLNTDGGEGLRDINERPADDGPDVEAVIAEARKTDSDDAALAFWKSHNAQFAAYPASHKRLKDEIAIHRTKLREAANTIEQRMPEVPQKAEPDPEFIAGLDAGEQQ
jgi:recombination protein RecT